MATPDGACVTNCAAAQIFEDEDYQSDEEDVHPMPKRERTKKQKIAKTLKEVPVKKKK